MSRKDPTIGDIVRIADKSGMNVKIDLIPRELDSARTIPPIGRHALWMTDHVYSVTARLYCRCGEAVHHTAAWLTVIEEVMDFWARHSGEDHGPTTPEICGRARRKRQRAGPWRPSA